MSTDQLQLNNGFWGSRSMAQRWQNPNWFPKCPTRCLLLCRNEQLIPWSVKLKCACLVWDTRHSQYLNHFLKPPLQPIAIEQGGYITSLPLSTDRGTMLGLLYDSDVSKSPTIRMQLIFATLNNININLKQNTAISQSRQIYRYNVMNMKVCYHVNHWKCYNKLQTL